MVSTSTSSSEIFVGVISLVVLIGKSVSVVGIVVVVDDDIAGVSILIGFLVVVFF